MSLDLNINEDLKKEGEQRELSRQIKDKRKELSLRPQDFIIVKIEKEKLNLFDDNYKTEMKIKEVLISDSFEIEKAL